MDTLRTVTVPRTSNLIRTLTNPSFVTATLLADYTFTLSLRLIRLLALAFALTFSLKTPTLASTLNT